MKKCDNLLQRNQYIHIALHSVIVSNKKDYFTRSIYVARILLKQGFPFQSHDESKDSSKQRELQGIMSFCSGTKSNIKKGIK